MKVETNQNINGEIVTTVTYTSAADVLDKFWMQRIASEVLELISKEIANKFLEEHMASILEKITPEAVAAIAMVKSGAKLANITSSRDGTTYDNQTTD